jgi:natural product biosynthesis luciferase-like monooxygenase protein
MMTKALHCLVIGDEPLLVQCAEILRARGHVIAGFVAESEFVRNWARPLAVSVHAPGNDLNERLASVAYDWVFGIANLRPIPRETWRKAAQGAVVFHDAPLPRYAGFNAPTWAILAGESQHGVTWHALTAQDNEGEIYAQRRFDVAPDETALTLNAKCFEAGIETFQELIRSIEEGTLAPTAQDPAARLYHGRYDRPPAAVTLRFDRPAAELAALVRALDFGPGYPNPMSLPKLRTDAGVYAVRSLEVQEDARCQEPPGTVLAVEGNGATIATADYPVRLLRLAADGGTEIPASAVLRAGERLPRLSEAEAARLTAVAAELAPHEAYFAARLAELRPIVLPEIEAAPEGGTQRLAGRAFRLPERLSGNARIAAVAAYLARAAGEETFDLAYADDTLAALAAEFPGYLAVALPIRVDASGNATAAGLAERIDRELRELRARRAYFADLPARLPGLAPPRCALGLFCTERPSLQRAIAGCAATFVVPARGSEALFVFDEARLPASAAEALLRRLGVACAAFAEDPRCAAADLPLLSAEERAQVLYGWNQTEALYERDACVHTLIEQQVDASPESTALVFGAQTLSYRDLEARANQVAHALREAGVGPDSLVGLYMRRSLELVVCALGIHKAGGAYVPLDPSYPPGRLALMLEDCGARVLLTQRDLLGSIPASVEKVLCVEDQAVARAPVARPQGGAAPYSLAYVIYTSGSTGKPKGVMIEHRNVVNFFAGMDARIERGPGPQPVWLAVTSLSFDISVLELFWTLARGFQVVIGTDDDRLLQSRGTGSSRPMHFGLFYWGNDDAPGPQKYRLLIEGAKFADAHGFSAVWTPERHFHAFGGPYPNPAVTAAAVAAVTRNVGIRAGSCVLPLHHPARVAEEWAVVDNLSNGRVGVSFASGWMPEDFLLRPENAPPHNNSSMIRDIEVVRRLWRGEAVTFDSPVGGPLAVITQPRPVQKELPLWVTTAGNPETYRKAAEIGANVLTHLLGQSIDDVAGKVRLYREALAVRGRDPAAYRVTLMLHTLIGRDRERVRALARRPMKDYLRSATALIKHYAWSFPAFRRPPGVDKPIDINLGALPEEELDAILEFAFERYFSDSGLFGTVEDAIRRVEQLKAIGVDEIACLIDFGIATDAVLDGLPLLAEVMRRTSRPASGAEGEHGIATQIMRRAVTHLQCTPSMVRMMITNDEARAAMSRIRHFFIGGEALPGALVSELRQISPAATVENMYGPTETTIWSSTQRAEPCDGVVPLGSPIANTQFYVLDARLQPVPLGTAGELYIGGAGVARGYLNRDDLTRERFLADPFRKEGRIYRTGDLVRFTPSGALQFLGRTDFQVKVRGFRIELGEIEARIARHPGVREAVVVAREDRPDDVRLVAYLRFRGAAVSDDALRAHLREALPEHMVPAHFVAMERFPLTPNAKIDRKALPAPEQAQRAAVAEYLAPQSDLQRQIAEVYRKVLGVAQIGLADSFFKLGGHSLLAVQAHRELRAAVSPKLTITDVFRFPTVAALAGYLEDTGKAAKQLERVADRAAARREAMLQRRGLRRARADK